MFIPQKLPQFDGRKLLIIVSGELQVKYYLAHDGQIYFLDSFFVANPRTEPTDDYFRNSRLGIAASVYDRDRKTLQRKLLHRLRYDTTQIFKRERISETYLFCIDYMMKRVKSILPQEVWNTISFEYLGDMQYHTPLFLMEIVQQKRFQNSLAQVRYSRK